MTGSCEHGIDDFGAYLVVRIDTVRYLGVTRGKDLKVPVG